MFVFAVIFVVYAFLCGQSVGGGIFLGYVVSNYTVEYAFIRDMLLS